MARASLLGVCSLEKAMRWLLAILCVALIFLWSLWLIGSDVLLLPRKHDPFPASARMQLDQLNNSRAEIAWLVGKARFIGKESDLAQEEPTYEELAAQANAVLAQARAGLELNNVDAPFLDQKLGELIPKAKSLAETLRSKQPTQLGTVNLDEIAPVVEKGWRDLEIFVKRTIANAEDSTRIAMEQLEKMKWAPWSDLKANPF